MPSHASSPRRRGFWIAIGAPVAVVVALVGAWAIDTAASGAVVRNVKIDGVDVGGDSDAELTAALASYAGSFATRPVRIVTPNATYDTTAAEIGLTVDVAATADRARDAGRGFPVARPFTWVAALLSPHDVEPVLSVDADKVAAEVVGLEGDARIAPTEPTITLDEDGTVQLLPGQPGNGIDPTQVASRLVDAASDGANPIVVSVSPESIPPTIADADIQAVADQANARTEDPLAVTVGDSTVDVEPAVVRSWLRLVPVEGSTPGITVDGNAAVEDLAPLFPGVGHPAQDASMTLQGDTPVVVPSVDGTGCCADDSGPRIQDAIEGGTGAVTLETTTTPADISTEDVQGYGITQPVGGSRAWPVSREPGAAPGFTTFHQAGEARVTNIHRIADIVRGTIVPPGGTFSVNDRVGRRTTENGFVEAGAIRDGEHVSEVGGGVSQFATTLFNAAYFAGLDIDEYQAHSEYFSRYPRGREATMGFPAPDLKFTNNTPYGIMIWTSYTGTSLTVTLWSTPYATAEQTGITESRSGNCTVVTTTRTRHFPDKPDDTDTFHATYRPGPGQFC